MSESIDINVQVREDGGRGASRRLRRMGMVPGILYGGHEDPQMIAVAHNELAQRLERETFYSRILDLSLDGNTVKVVLKDLQRHPAKPFVTHVDFQRISADEKIRMLVPLHFINENTCPGVKMGGIVTHNINQAEIVCLPKDLPEFIIVDMADMGIGNSVHLGELIMPEGVELSHALDMAAPVVSVHGVRGSDEELEEEAEGEAEVDAEGESEV